VRDKGWNGNIGDRRKEVKIRKEFWKRRQLWLFTIRRNWLNREPPRTTKEVSEITMEIDLLKKGSHCMKQEWKSVFSNLSNSVALVREQTTPTERQLHVGEVSANFCGKGCHLINSTYLHCRILGFIDRSRSSVVLTRLSGPRSRPTTSQKIW
jgi:hypothetical protein